MDTTPACAGPGCTSRMSGKTIRLAFGVCNPKNRPFFFGSCNLQVANSCYQFFWLATSFRFVSGLLAAHVIKNSSYATLTATEHEQKSNEEQRGDTARERERVAGAK